MAVEGYNGDLESDMMLGLLWRDKTVGEMVWTAIALWYLITNDLLITLSRFR